MTATATRAREEAQRLEKKFGHKTGAIGTDKYQLKVVPTGSLALDYALGTGGWPLGHPVEVFGMPDIGKSSVIGLSAIKNAQAMGLLCGIIALEPGFDPEWAYTNGVDPETVIIARPDSGDIGFSILYQWCTGETVDFVVFDSIGAVVAEAEQAEDGSSKSRVGGQSKLITDGIKRILTPTWKHDKGVLLLNQQRDDMNARHPGAKTSPGGNAVHHSAAIRVHLRPKDKPFKEIVEGDEVVVGRTLLADIIRNKLTEGSQRKAEFDFYQMDSEQGPVGIDWAKDVVSTAIRTGVIRKGGAWYYHESFPKAKSGEHQLQGKDNVYDYLKDDEHTVTKIRQEVIEAMLKENNE